MTSNEFGGKYAPKKKDPLKPWYPLIGIILIAIAGAVGFFLRQPVYAFLERTLLKGAGNLPAETMEYIVAGGIALVIIGVFSAVFALFAPKTNKLVTEKHLLAQKQEAERERLRAKKRKYQMRQKMKQANRGRSE